MAYMICGSAQHNESAPGGATMVMNYRGAGLNRNEGIGFSYVQHGSLHEKETFLKGRLLELFCEAVAPEGNDNPSYTGVLTLEVGELFDKIIVSLNNGEYTIELDYSLVFNNCYVYKTLSYSSGLDLWNYLGSKLNQNVTIELIYAG